MEKISKQIYCETCNKMIERQFRFTDWDNDYNDVYGDFDFCLKLFNKAIKEDPEGRYSIYAVTICDDCDNVIEDEGVLFNESCPVYA